jgi:hypothetical protein
MDNDDYKLWLAVWIVVAIVAIGVFVARMGG